jgi:RNA polymerase sigma-70 factor (ECF subfamily)
LTNRDVKGREITETVESAAAGAGDAGLDALVAARAGDGGAASRLVERHGPSMLRTAWRVLGRYGGTDAEDAVQDALVAALTTNALPSGDTGAWLRAIAARKALDLLRRSRRRGALEIDRSEEPMTGGDAVDVIAARQALAALSATDRAVLTLVDLDGYTTVEAADALGLSRVAVRLRVSRARRKLRRLLEEGNAEGGDGP